ncbi:Na+:solute symporter [Clostridium sediminicola]|uniref:sodium:solute symporter family transporter n=1 Tax=Clostridium sediminicola TaxID=3114879 RepID=UPI0031F2152B
MDILVVIVYFAFLVAIGWLFRSFTSSTSDYFRGGGKMLWWMVGATAFMTQFSAWTFTGAAGKAFTDGFSIVILFFANAVGYFCNFLFFAAKARQMRVVTPIEGIRMRYGKVNEQVFTWATMPSSILQAAVWLNGLAIFVSAVFDISISHTIIATGLVVVIMSVTGGAWAVIASDFMQMVIIMSVSFVASVVAVVKSGGITPIFEKGLPEMPIAGQNINYVFLFTAWVIAIFAKQFFSTNNMIGSYRYICAKDTKNARKAALLACCLMFVGPLIWFIPAWFVAGKYPDPSTWGLDMLGKSIKNATYYVFVRKELPVGMIGLMMSAVFAATMSSMDSALNRNAGIFVKNFYKPILNKNADEKNLLVVSKISTLVFGAIIIFAGLFLNNLKGTNLFEMMMMISTLVAFPILLPSLLGFFVKKTPDWAGWGTILVGMGVSYFIAFVVTPEMMQNILGLAQPLTSREFGDMRSVTLGIVLHLGITMTFYLMSQLFYKGHSEERQKEVDQFFYNTSTEVIAEHDDEVEVDNKQRMMLGRLIQAGGAGITALLLVPNPLWGRIVFIAVGGIVFFVGTLLVKSVTIAEKKTIEIK